MAEVDLDSLVSATTSQPAPVTGAAPVDPPTSPSGGQAPPSTTPSSTALSSTTLPTFVEAADRVSVAPRPEGTWDSRPPSASVGRRRRPGAVPVTRGGGRPAPAPVSSPTPSRVRKAFGAGIAVAAVSAGIGLLLLLPGGDRGAPGTLAGPSSGVPAGSAFGPVPTDRTVDPAAPAEPAAPTIMPDTTDGSAAAAPLASPSVGPSSGPVASTPPLPSSPTPAPPASVPSPSPPPSPPRPPTTAPAAPSRPAVTVLNNSRRGGLADRAAQRFRSNGWPVDEVGNYNRDVLARSTVFYGPGQQAAGQRFAEEFGIPRVLARTSGVPAGLTVVLTRDFSP